MQYFTADQHFGHANIIKYCDRPFADVAEMNRVMVELWNDIVRPTDEVWVLGDVAMGNRSETLRCVGGLHGRKILLPGNHDTCWRGHRKGAGKRSLYLESGFERIVDEEVTLELAGLPVLLSHFPYRNDGPSDESYARFRPADEGGWLLHGHVHETWLKCERMINVGVDVWDFRPASADRIEDLIRSGPSNGKLPPPPSSLTPPARLFT